jgi:hypothetical protein
MLNVGDLVISRGNHTPVQVFDGYPGFWMGTVVLYQRDPTYRKYIRLHVLIGDEIKKSWLTDAQLIQSVEVIK